MRFLSNVMAVLIVVGTFIYTNSYVWQLFKSKAYLGAVGVFILSLLAVGVPFYVLFFL